jgi:hypothetical protein
VAPPEEELQVGGASGRLSLLRCRGVPERVTLTPPDCS